MRFRDFFVERISPLTYRVVLPAKGKETHFRLFLHKTGERGKNSHSPVSFSSRRLLDKLYSRYINTDLLNIEVEPLVASGASHGRDQSRLFHKDCCGNLIFFNEREREFCLGKAGSGKRGLFRRKKLEFELYPRFHRIKPFGTAIRSFDVWIEEAFKLPLMFPQPGFSVFHNEFLNFGGRRTFGFLYEDRSGFYCVNFRGSADSFKEFLRLEVRDFYISMHDENILNDGLLKGAYRRIFKSPYREILLNHLYPRDNFDLSMLEASLTFGFTPLPPFRTLGLWYSKWAELSDLDYLKTLAEFRKRGYPVSVLLIDTDWRAENSRCGRWRGYRWDQNLFPDPVGFLKKIKSEFHSMVGLNDHPGYGEEHYVEELSKSINWYSLSDYQEFSSFLSDFLSNYDVDFWWVDGWGYQMHVGIESQLVVNHLYFSAAEKVKKRPFILSRFAGAGGSRYPYAFSGDVYSDFESLLAEIILTKETSASMVPHWSHDTGGFMGHVIPKSLFAGWVAFTALSPSFRLHSSGGPREPWLYGEAFDDYFRFFYNLRASLSLFIYEKLFETSLSGKPFLVPPEWKGFESVGKLFPAALLIGETILYIPLSQRKNINDTSPRGGKLMAEEIEKFGFIPIFDYSKLAELAASLGKRSLSEFFIKSVTDSSFSVCTEFYIRSGKNLPLVSPEIFNLLSNNRLSKEKIFPITIYYLDLPGTTSFRVYMDESSGLGDDGIFFSEIKVRNGRIVDMSGCGDAPIEFKPVSPERWLVSLFQKNFS